MQSKHIFSQDEGWFTEICCLPPSLCTNTMAGEKLSVHEKFESSFENGKVRVKCRYCDQTFCQNTTRMREHLTIKCKKASKVLSRTEMDEFSLYTERKRSTSARNDVEAGIDENTTEGRGSAKVANLILTKWFIEHNIPFSAVESNLFRS